MEQKPGHNATISHQEFHQVSGHVVTIRSKSSQTGTESYYLLPRIQRNSLVKFKNAPSSDAITVAGDQIGPCNEVLLSTALVRVNIPSREHLICRALLDTGSQASFISKPCAIRLGVKLKPARVQVEGVGSSKVQEVYSNVTVQIQSLLEPEFKYDVETLIIPEVTTNLPMYSFHKGDWPYLGSLKLADPKYNESSPIDMLLGADCLNDILREGIRRGGVFEPMAQDTFLGWVLLGPVVVSHVSTRAAKVPPTVKVYGTQSDEQKDRRSADTNRPTRRPNWLFSNLPRFVRRV